LDGFGLLDLIVVSAAILLAYRALSRYEPAPVPIGELAGVPQYAGTVVAVPPPRLAREPEAIIPVESGVDRIRQADSGFDPGSFATSVTRCFTAVQAAWTARNLWAAGDLLTDEMRERLQRESDRLRSQGHVNRVERIDIKRATIVDARQRDGWDIIAVDIEAMLIDYTTNESGLNVVEGNPFELVPFRECWEFVRPSGPNPWQVGGIR
jgi:predicted lipid-binding transport protein (Tim44 family)